MRTAAFVAGHQGALNKPLSSVAWLANGTGDRGGYAQAPFCHPGELATCYKQQGWYFILLVRSVRACHPDLRDAHAYT